MRSIKAQPLLSDFFQRGKIVKFKKGELLIDTNKPSKYAYYIKSGFVSFHSKKNGEYIYVIYKKGEIFSILAALQESKEYVARGVLAEALGEVEVYQVPLALFHKFIYSNHQVLLEVTNLLMNLVILYFERLENLAINKTYPRVISRLLYFADRFGKRIDNNKVLIELPLTHNLFANSISIARETTTRDLKKMAAKGLISYKRNQITIFNEDNLIKELQIYE